MRVRPAACLAVLVGLVLVTFGVIRATDGAAPARAAGAVPTVDSGRLPAARSPAGDGGTPSTAQTPRRTVPRGAHLRSSRLGVDAPVVPVRAVAGVMQVPRDPRTLGWWTGGRAPGDGSGTTVIVGHVNYSGVSGALAALPRLRPGDVITLVGRHYRVAALRTYPKSLGLPASAFRRDGSAQLVLITCGGPFDTTTGNYEDNIVAYAVPTP